MKKHYKGLAVALSAVMLAGGSFTAYAGPASEAGSPAAPSGNSGDSGLVRAAQLPQGTSSNSLTQNRQRWRIPLFM